jgi:large subunit ribosomal protein L25
MGDTATILAEKRTSLGTSNSRRLRNAGRIPANLFGEKLETVALTLSSSEATPLIVSGANVVDLTIDGQTEKAVVREVQWNTFLTQILHVDLQRIDASARLDVEVSIEVRGIANEGAMELAFRSLTVNCPVVSVPSAFEVRIGALKIGDEITVGDLDIPDDCTTQVLPETVVLRINEVIDLDEEEEESPDAGLEPEVIGRPADEEAPE